MIFAYTNPFFWLNRVISVVDFEADVLGGNWVTVGFDFSLVRLVTYIGGTEKRIRGKWSKNGIAHGLLM